MKTYTGIPGIHHVTAVSSTASENLVFYESILGLRLVKQTVNFDNPFTYHLYYGDEQGSPGTLLTFFPWQDPPRGTPGAGMVTAIALAIPDSATGFWTERLKAAGVGIRVEERFGETVIRLSDPHGLPIELVGRHGIPETVLWRQGPIAGQHAIAGLHSATATLHELAPIREFLTNTMGMTLHGREGDRYRFTMGDRRAPGEILDVLLDPQAAVGQPGAGTVHHIAFRTPDADAQLSWQAALRKSGVNVTEVRDRKYFRSIYFSSPGGVLFEIATDRPGFTVDEASAELGNALKLPAPYEPMRAEIEKRLPGLRATAFRHVFKEALRDADDGRTLVALHGTGGDERDLLGFAEAACGTAAILSPRGKVLENGMARYFERRADGRFEVSEVARRAHELSDFIAAATLKHHRDPERLTAMGYSNGANIAAAILLLRPEIFSGAVLMRPMLPLQAAPAPDLHGKEILVLKGARDSVIASADTDRLVEILEKAGAQVTLRVTPGGHELTAQDLRAALIWLQARQFPDQCVLEEEPVMQRA